MSLVDEWSWSGAGGATTAAASGALRYFDPRAAEDAARWAAGCREVVVLMPGSRRADRPTGLPHDEAAARRLAAGRGQGGHRRCARVRLRRFGGVGLDS